MSDDSKPLKPLVKRAGQLPRAMQPDAIAKEEPEPAMTARRDEKGRLLPGSNLNPLGVRPSPNFLVRQALECARENAPRAMRKLVQLLDDEDPKVQTVAADKILTLAGAYREANMTNADSGAAVEPGTIDREKLIEMLRKTRKGDE